MEHLLGDGAWMVEGGGGEMSMPGLDPRGARVRAVLRAVRGVGVYKNHENFCSKSIKTEYVTR